MIWIIIISILLSLLFWFLAGPLIFFMDTETNRYHLMLPGIFKAMVIPGDGLFYFRLWIFFIPVRINPFKSRERNKKKKLKQPKNNKRGLVKSNNIQLLGSLIQCLRVKTLKLDLDTGDFLFNSWLVPAFSSINKENIRMRVNFEDHSSLKLDLRTHLGSLLWVLIRYKYRSIINLKM